MKKINLTAFLLTLTTVVISQEVDWKVGLTPIPPGQNSDFGTPTADPINFYTNGTKKMTLDPDGNLQLNGSFDVGNGILLNSESVLRKQSYTSGSTTSSYLMLGKGAAPNTNDVFLGPCSSPNANGWTVTNGGLISGAFGMPSPNQVNSFLKVFADNTNGNGYIELEGVSNTGLTNNALFINNNCGRNTNINLASGGVFMGNHVNMKTHVEIGDPTTGITSPSGNIALDIHTHAGTGIRFKTNTDAMELITVENNSNSNFKKTFTVLGDGKTEISTENADALVVKNLNYSNNISFNVKSDGRTEIYTYMPKALSIWSQNSGYESFSFNSNGSLEIKTSVANNTDNVLVIKDGSNVKNFQVSKNGKTIIGNLTQTTGNHTNALLTVNGKAVAQEVIVTQQNWADFVFANDYKLMPISELENYYRSEKHLPNIPSTEQIKQNGNNVAETDALLLQKIEELTLYLVEQQKQIESLKIQLKNK